MTVTPLMRAPTIAERSDIAMAIAHQWGLEQDVANAHLDHAAFIGVLDGYEGGELRKRYAGRVAIVVYKKGPDYIESFIWPNGECRSTVGSR